MQCGHPRDTITQGGKQGIIYTEELLSTLDIKAHKHVFVEIVHAQCV